MNELWGHAVGIFILLMMLGFIGLWIWAWRPRHRATFDWLAQLPLEQDSVGQADTVMPTPATTGTSTPHKEVES